MKKIVTIMIGIMVFTSCKKSEVKPMEEPVQQAPVAQCKNELQLLKGKYEITATKDTIEIVFVSDNCPQDNSNNYVVKGLAKAIQTYASSIIENKDYNIKSNEIVRQGVTSDNIYSFTLQGNPATQLVLQSNKLTVPQLTFKKL